VLMSRFPSAAFWAQAEGATTRVVETVAASDLLAQRADEALAIDRDAETSPNASQQLGDVEGRAGLLEHVEGHVNLGQTPSSTRRGLALWSLAQATNRTQLSV